MRARLTSWFRAQARAGRGPLASWAVAWLSRPAAVARWGRSTALERDAGSSWSIDPDLVALLETMAVARSRSAAARARAALETVWAAGPPHRAEIWTIIWWRDRCLPPAVVRFLLDPDPESPHEPRIRLVTGLSLRTRRLSGNKVAGAVVAMARSAPDPQIRRELADVLSRTDQPELLDELLDAFARALGCLPGLGGRYYYLLWGEDGSAPTPLLTAMLTNPHLLPRLRAAASDNTRRALVVLMALRNRTDLLDELDGRLVAWTLLVNAGVTANPAPLVEACRRVLLVLPPGAAREAVCALALEHHTHVTREAAAVATDAGYRPADSAVAPLFLVRTRRWDELVEIDPAGERLYAYCVRSAFDAMSGAGMVETLLRLVEDDSAPATGRDAGRRALRDQEPGPARDHLCARALGGQTSAVRAVVDGRLVPSDRDTAAALLFLTGQWDRYDAADPGGTRLRAYGTRLYYWESERDRLRAAAERAGRPMPCDASTSTPPPSRQYWPGGSATSGSGGYTQGSVMFGI